MIFVIDILTYDQILLLLTLNRSGDITFTIVLFYCSFYFWYWWALLQSSWPRMPFKKSLTFSDSSIDSRLFLRSLNLFPLGGMLLTDFNGRRPNYSSSVIEILGMNMFSFWEFEVVLFLRLDCLERLTLLSESKFFWKLLVFSWTPVNFDRHYSTVSLLIVEWLLLSLIDEDPLCCEKLLIEGFLTKTELLCCCLTWARRSSISACILSFSFSWPFRITMISLSTCFMKRATFFLHSS